MHATTAVLKTNTDFFVHGSTAELVHSWKWCSSEFLILCLDLKLYFKRNPNSAIVYPHGRHPTPPAVQREMGEKGSDMDTDRNGESGVCGTFLNVLQIKFQLCSHHITLIISFGLIEKKKW